MKHYVSFFSDFNVTRMTLFILRLLHVFFFCRRCSISAKFSLVELQVLSRIDLARGPFCAESILGRYRLVQGPSFTCCLFQFRLCKCVVTGCVSLVLRCSSSEIIFRPVDHLDAPVPQMQLCFTFWYIWMKKKHSVSICRN